MIQIPNQLKNYKFIKTYRKRAIEKAWPVELHRYKKRTDGAYIDSITNLPYKASKDKDIYKGPVHSYDYEYMNEELKQIELRDPNNVTYGVLCGYNGLVVVDIDDKKLFEKIKDKYPFNKTFSVKSAGKNLPHYYFKCDEYSETTFYEEKKKRLIDVQGKSSFVIGPNSKTRSNNQTNQYTVFNDTEIMEINYNKLLEILDEILPESRKITKKQINPYTGDSFILDPLTAEIFKKINCDDILSEIDIDVTNNPGDTPFAKSEGGKCLHRTGYLWFDFHIQEGGNLIQLYAKIHKIDSIKAKFELAEKVGVKEEIFQQAIEFHIKQKNHDMTELLAMKFLSTTPTYTIRSDKSKNPEIYIYKDGIYIGNGISYIQEFCNNILGKYYTQANVNKVVDKIAVRTLIDAEEFFQEADSKYIPVNNGILNIETKKLYEFTPEMKFFNKLPINYIPEKPCEATKKHFNTVLNNEKDILTMQELYGYLLLRNYKFEKAFMFIGNGGNGKSKTIDQMRVLIGDYNAVNLSLQQLQNEKFSRCNLHGKLANLADDIGCSKLEETQIFKELTGGSNITVDRKHMTSLTFKNYAKMVFSANQIPATADKTDGFCRRWIIIDFVKIFVSEPEYKKLEQTGKLTNHHRIADNDIIEKLTTKEELSGVLNWALEGYHRLMKQKGFTKNDSSNEIRIYWDKKESTAINFYYNCITQTYNPEEYETADDLYYYYCTYCQENKLIPEPAQTFTSKLRNYNLICKRKRIATGNEWRWLGIKIRR